MATVIHKKELTFGVNGFPPGAKIINIQQQGHLLCAWYEVDELNARDGNIVPLLKIIGTGNCVPLSHPNYHSTHVLRGSEVVCHIYQR